MVEGIWYMVHGQPINQPTDMKAFFLVCLHVGRWSAFNERIFITPEKSFEYQNRATCFAEISFFLNFNSTQLNHDLSLIEFNNSKNQFDNEYLSPLSKG